MYKCYFYFTQVCIDLKQSILKHMKSIITLIITALTLNSIYAQSKPENVKIIIGEEIKLKRKELIDKILGKDANGTYVMSKNGSEIALFYYDNELNLLKKNTIELEFQKHKLDYQRIYQRGESFVMLTTYKDKKKKVSYLYIQELNTTNLTFSTPKIIGETSYEGYRNGEAGRFWVLISENGSHLMVKTYPPSRKGEDYYFDVSVYDIGMIEEWSMNGIKMVYDSTSSSALYDAQLGNNGSYYRLLKNTDKSRKYKRREVDYSFSMEVYLSGDDKPMSFQLKVSGEHITDINFEELETGGIQVVGFYSTKGQGQNGVYNLIYDSKFNLISETKQEFPLDFMVQHSSERAKKKAKKKEAKGKEMEMHSYTIDDIIEHEDGTVTMIAEEFYIYTTTTTDQNGATRTVTHYIYGNIIMVKYDKDGAVDWMELIPKNQHSTDGGYYSGYAMMQLSNGNIVLVFNDDPRNSFYEQSGMFYTWNSVRKSTKRTDVVFYEITEEGEAQRHIIYKGGEEEVFSRPFVSLEVGKNQMVILGQKKKQTKFVKLIFDHD